MHQDFRKDMISDQKKLLPEVITFFNSHSDKELLTLTKRQAEGLTIRYSCWNWNLGH